MYDVLMYVRMRLVARARTERGASAVEYGVLVAGIAVVIIVAVSMFGDRVSLLFSRSSASLPS
jgi:pilus assembly protein Flp/PilA